MSATFSANLLAAIQPTGTSAEGAGHSSSDKAGQPPRPARQPPDDHQHRDMNNIKEVGPVCDRPELPVAEGLRNITVRPQIIIEDQEWSDSAERVAKRLL